MRSDERAAAAAAMPSRLSPEPRQSQLSSCRRRPRTSRRRTLRCTRCLPLRGRAAEGCVQAERTVGGGELGGSVCRFPQEDGQRQVGLLDLGVVSGPEFTAEAWRARSRAGHGTGGSAVQQFSTGAHRMPLLAGDDWQRCTRSSMSALEAWKAMLHRTDAIAGSRRCFSTLRMVILRHRCRGMQARYRLSRARYRPVTARYHLVTARYSPVTTRYRLPRDY